MSTSSDNGFGEFILKENKHYWPRMLILVTVQFILFKFCFPFPDFISDSYNYILGAQLHLDVNIWPIGYSRFLSTFHWFTTSAFALVLFQYSMYIFSASYFYFTLIYFYKTGRFTRIMLSVVLFFNPLLLFLANYVSSDTLFASMSTIWLTQLIWVIRRPKPVQIFVQAGLMLILFSFRYNAMIYPILSAIAFSLSPQVVWRKFLGVITGPTLILLFIIWSSGAAKKLTGTAQFPPILGGWQWGNNALYMRGYIKEDTAAFPSQETAELDRISRKFFSRPDHPLSYIASSMGNFFIIHPEAPLKQYVMGHYTIDSYNTYVASWGKAAVIYDKYGKFLIRRHLLAYARYYLFVNAENYCLPPLEHLEPYNMGQTTMWPIGQEWFEYASPRVWCLSSGLKEICWAPSSLLFLLANLYFVFGLAAFIHQGGIRKSDLFVRQTVALITLFWLLNAAFSIFANIIVIRYQIFPLVVLFSFGQLLLEFTEKIPKLNKVT